MVTVAGEHFVTILERLGNMGDGEQGRSPPPPPSLQPQELQKTECIDTKMH